MCRVSEVSICRIGFFVQWFDLMNINLHTSSLNTHTCAALPKQRSPPPGFSCESLTRESAVLSFPFPSSSSTLSNTCWTLQVHRNLEIFDLGFDELYGLLMPKFLPNMKVWLKPIIQSSNSREEDRINRTHVDWVYSWLSALGSWVLATTKKKKQEFFAELLR